MSATILLSGVMSAVYLISTGVGVWGSNIPVGWAFDITNFVFWIGIGHAGTLISAILFLFRQKWRTSINRFSEAMTIFAVICAWGVPWYSRGAVLVRLVHVPAAECQLDLPELSFGSSVGLVRRFDVLHDFSFVLVHRSGSRPRDPSAIVQPTSIAKQFSAY